MLWKRASVFPARAGMSPRARLHTNPRNGVPRASGDEPNNFETMADFEACSPRERG